MLFFHFKDHCMAKLFSSSITVGPETMKNSEYSMYSVKSILF